MDSPTTGVTLVIWSVIHLYMRAYVFIDSTRKAAGKITAELQKNPRIVTADVINGPHPVIACVEAENPSLIAQTVLFDIRKINGVKDMTVYLSTDGQDGRYSDDILPDSLLPDFSKSLSGESINRRRRRSRKSNAK